MRASVVSVQVRPAAAALVARRVRRVDVRLHHRVHVVPTYRHTARAARATNRLITRYNERRLLTLDKPSGGSTLHGAREGGTAQATPNRC